MLACEPGPPTTPGTAMARNPLAAQAEAARSPPQNQGSNAAAPMAAATDAKNANPIADLNVTTFPRAPFPSVERSAGTSSRSPQPLRRSLRRGAATVRSRSDGRATGPRKAPRATAPRVRTRAPRTGRATIRRGAVCSCPDGSNPQRRAAHSSRAVKIHHRTGGRTEASCGAPAGNAGRGIGPATPRGYS